MHIQSYSRKANPRVQSVEQVLAEAARAPVYSKHVVEPQPPSVVYGVAANEVRKLHDDMVAAGGIDVTLKDGRKARRGIRKDRHTLMTAVASHPLAATERALPGDFPRDLMACTWEGVEARMAALAA